jgi:hypothetical protein
VRRTLAEFTDDPRAASAARVTAAVIAALRSAPAPDPNARARFAAAPRCGSAGAVLGVLAAGLAVLLGTPALSRDDGRPAVYRPAAGTLGPAHHRVPSETLPLPEPRDTTPC